MWKLIIIMTFRDVKESLPGNNLWLNPYKIAIGTVHINMDAMRNFCKTPAIVPLPPTLQQLKLHAVMFVKV